MKTRLGDIILKSNTGLDAIKRAPIVVENTGIKCLRITDISQNKRYSDWGNTKVLVRDYEKFKLQKNDILIARTGATIGVNILIKENLNAVYNNGLIRLQIDSSKADPIFIYYILNTRDYWHRIHAISSGTVAQPNMKINDLLDYTFDFPNLLVQKKIASLLSSLDDKIELNKKMIRKLEKIAQTVYKSWFINLEPFGGTMPINWKIGSIVENDISFVIKPGVKYFNKKTYLATADVNGLNIGKGKIIDFTTRETRANMQPTLYSIWFAKMKNSVKHLLLNEYSTKLIEDTILSTGFCGIQCTEKSFEYLSTYLRIPGFEKEKDFRAHGTTQEAVNIDDLRKIEMIIPSDDVLEKFHCMTKSIYNLINSNFEENRKLIELRDELLPKLLTGEIDISNLDIY